MDQLKANELRELLQQPSQPSVSIYMPTHATAPDHFQNPVRLRNLLREAQSHLRPEVPADFLRPAWTLVEDDKFWKGRGAGLCVLASPTMCRAIRLPIELPERVEVGDQFVLRPLLPLLTQQRYLLLSLSRNRTRLFELTDHEIQEVTPDTMPTGLADLNHDQYDRGAQVHSGSRGTRGKAAAVFHGQGGHVETVKGETAQLFHLIDGHLKGTLPLILAGVGEHLAQFRSVTHYPQVCPEQIEGNLDRLSAQQIHQRAGSTLQAMEDRRRFAALKRWREADRKKVAERLPELLPASEQGRIDTLLISNPQPVWGQHVRDSRFVELHQHREAGDSDLLEAVCVETLSHSGRVISVGAQELDADVAAIFRY